MSKGEETTFNVCSGMQDGARLAMGKEDGNKEGRYTWDQFPEI